jgi:signal transduction histidine kinase
MLKHAFVTILFVLAGISVSAQAADRGTAKEAQLMVERAILFYDTQGAADAFATFTMAQPPYRDRDLYIFVFDTKGVILAHAGQPELVGQNMMEVRDANDVPLIRRMVEQATENGVWVDYVFQDPLTGEPAPKSSWVVLHDGYVFGTGIYAP